uniref:Uncharacterized protein n=1 Tax=Rhizophora mucronata TaxID=61149 RepID=A0A2P2MZS3_RHIMU
MAMEELRVGMIVLGTSLCSFGRMSSDDRVREHADMQLLQHQVFAHKLCFETHRITKK